MGLIILDYGAGNLKSLTNMLDSINYQYKVTDQKKEIIRAERLILPGVGHFGQFMESLHSKDLIDCLKKVIGSGTPFLGICVGLQVLFEESEEAPGVKGLGVFPGKVVRFTKGKVPQIGWNELKITKNNRVLSNDYVYFVNSYAARPENPEIISAYSSYHDDFTAAVEHRNIFAFQFHPEKSGHVGYNYIQRWLKIQI